MTDDLKNHDVTKDEESAECLACPHYGKNLWDEPCLNCPYSIWGLQSDFDMMYNDED